MANSYIEYTANGSTTTFSIPFAYTRQADVTVFVGGTSTSFTFASSSTISLSTAPTSGTIVRINRTTVITTRAVDFTNGAILTEADLDNSNIQVFQAAQEAIDTAEASISKAADGKFDAQSRVIKNVANPVNAQDAATKNWSETASTSQVNIATTKASEASSSATASANSATAASSSASGAGNSATAAANSATAAANSATASLASKNTSAAQAAISTTKAGQAASSTTAAANSATASGNSATASANSATASANSATASANSATASANSATSSGNSASTATTKANESTASASTANTKAELATTKATAATNSATASGNSATASGNSATASGNSATASGNSATASANSATASANSATASGNSATAAASSASTATTKRNESSASATAAANSAAAAATALDSFDDRYLGAKSSAPNQDNDGNALVQGALYFDTSANGMKVYDGSAWIAASSSGTASMLTYKYIATNNQTTFTGSDANSVTLTYTATNILVLLNGITLDASDYTATNGSSIVLGAGATTGSELVVVAFKSFTVADHYTKSQANALLAAKATTANFTSTGIDDNATGTKVTVSDTGTTVVGFIQSDSIGPAPGGLAAPGASLNWYKIGSLALHGAKAGVLTVLGTMDYSGAGTISAESKLTLRGGTVSTTLAGHYSGNSQGSPTAQFAWKNTASGVFDIYASNAQFGNLNSYYKGEGSWNASYSDTGSTSLPAGSTAFASKYGISINGAANFMFDSDGLKFHGDTAAANALDDYEEGTWTPAYAFGGSFNGVYSNQQGFYTKVGNMVHAKCFISCANHGSTTGSATVTGLPFASNSTYVSYSAVSQRYTGISTTNYPASYLGFNSTVILLQQITSSGGNVSNLQHSDFNTYTDLMINVTYQV